MMFDEAVEMLGQLGPSLIDDTVFAAWGREGNRDAPPRPIKFPFPRANHQVARFAYDPQDQAVTVSDQDGTDAKTWFEVRWWPYIDAPNLPELVDGEALAIVIRAYIFNGIEYKKAISRAVNLLPELQGFRHWLFTAFLSDNTIRIHTGDRLRPDPLARWMGLWPGEVKNKKRVPAGTSDFAYILDEKLYDLFDRLISGEINADATSFRDGIRRPIEALHWKRRDTILDLLTGDLYDGATGAIEWRDVVLRAPACVGEASSPDTSAVVPDAEAVRTKGSTNGRLPEAVRDVFLERWPDDIPAGMGRKEVDATIRERLGYDRDDSKPSQRTITDGIKLARAVIAERRG